MDWKAIAKKFGITSAMTDKSALDLLAGAFAERTVLVLSQVGKALGTEEKVTEANCNDVIAKALAAKGATGDPEPARKADPQMMELMRDNRRLKLNRLVESANILPCVCKALDAVYCSDDHLKRTLSSGLADNFEAVVAALKDNEPLALRKEHSRSQTLAELPKGSSDEESAMLSRTIETKQKAMLAGGFVM